MIKLKPKHMHKIYSMIYNRLFILLLSVFLSQDFPELGTQESLDVMTWNVEHFPKNNNTLQYVEEIIESSNLDIIALQEIENQNDFNTLANKQNQERNWSTIIESYTTS